MIKLPKDNQYVLAHLAKDNWRDSDDPDGNRYWVVVKFRRGLSLQERDLLPDSDPRKGTYMFADEHANNKVPYRWDTFGPSSYFGQEVDRWVKLP
jgi:hypothetical protein